MSCDFSYIPLWTLLLGNLLCAALALRSCWCPALISLLFFFLSICWLFPQSVCCWPYRGHRWGRSIRLCPLSSFHSLSYAIILLFLLSMSLSNFESVVLLWMFIDMKLFPIVGEEILGSCLLIPTVACSYLEVFWSSLVTL